MTPIIALRNVEKFYQHGVSRTYVLRRMTAEIREGEFVSIMGPSGAGKSTLLHIMGMFDSAWTGEYDFLGQPVHALNQKARSALHKQHMGFVFQSYHLLDNLTVYENLEIPLSYRDVQEERAPGHRLRRARPLPDRRARRTSIRTSSPAGSSSWSRSRAPSSPTRR